MELLTGAARDLTTAEAVQTGGPARVFGTQNGTFAIGRQRVRMMMTGPLPYDEGDEIRLAGRLMPDGTFAAFAGKNVTTGRTAYKGSMATLVISAAVFLMFLPLCVVVVGLPFSVTAAGVFLLSWRARSARKMVEGV